MKPIRVLQVLTIMNRGGAETMVMNYYRNIDRTKVQFDFLLHRESEGVFDNEILSLGGKIHKLQNISLKNLSQYKTSLDSFFKTHPEYKIVHSHLNGLSSFVLKAAKKNQVPVRIAHSHTSLYNLNINPFSKNRHSLNFIFKFFVQNYFKLKVPKYANHYYSCGKKAGLWLFGKQNIHAVTIINNAIDSNHFVYNEKQAKIIKEQLDLGNKLVIGHVGNFVVEKNHLFLIQVFNELLKLKKNSVLLLVGGGDSEQYKQLVSDMGIAEHVKFLGVRNDVNNILQAMDVFVFPSTNEGLPVTLIEAQSSGLKVFASDEISNELKITELVDFMPLKQSPKYWAEYIFEHSNYKRENTKDKIVKGNYDIENNSKMLQQFYLNALKN